MRTRFVYLLPIVWLAGTVMATGARADRDDSNCALKFEGTAPTVSIAYDPLSPAPQIVPLSISVRNNSGQTCSANLDIIATSKNTELLGPAGATLGYQLQGTGSSSGSGGSSGVVIGSINVNVPKGQTKVISDLNIKFLGSQFVAQGIYSATLDLRLGTQSDADRTTAQLQATVRPVAQIFFTGNIGNASMATLDFGTMTTGKTRTINVGIEANSQVAVTMQSDNGGAMKSTSDPDLTPISYTATFNGHTTALSGGASFLVTPPVRKGGATYPLTFTLGQVSGNFAGTYRDLVTVSVVAQ